MGSGIDIGANTLCDLGTPGAYKCSNTGECFASKSLALQLSPDCDGAMLPMTYSVLTGLQSSQIGSQDWMNANGTGTYDPPSIEEMVAKSNAIYAYNQIPQVVAMNAAFGTTVDQAQVTRLMTQPLGSGISLSTPSSSPGSTTIGLIDTASGNVDIMPSIAEKAKSYGVYVLLAIIIIVGLMFLAGKKVLHV